MGRRPPWEDVDPSPTHYPASRRPCLTCRHLDPGGVMAATCAAFPQGIPFAILTGQDDHRRPYPGDNGIRYEPRDGGSA